MEWGSGWDRLLYKHNRNSGVMSDEELYIINMRRIISNSTWDSEIVKEQCSYCFEWHIVDFYAELKENLFRTFFGGCFWSWWWFFFFFNCSIINLQYCVSFRCTAKCLGYAYICIYGFPGGSVGKGSACNMVDLGSIPGSGRSFGEKNGNPLQYSCLQNSMERGAWWITVHGVTKSRTQQTD